MLQALPADRFQLVSRKDTKPLPAYALTAGKAADEGSRRRRGSGCKPETASGAPAEGGIRLTMNGQRQAFHLLPGFVIHIAVNPEPPLSPARPPPFVLFRRPPVCLGRVARRRNW
jgi:uncharacterized protein (TIGR03435 family)